MCDLSESCRKQHCCKEICTQGNWLGNRGSFLLVVGYFTQLCVKSLATYGMKSRQNFIWYQAIAAMVSYDCP